MNFFDDEDIGQDETIDFDEFKIKMESKNEIKVLHEDKQEVQRLSQQLAALESPVVTIKKNLKLIQILPMIIYHHI